MDETKIEKEFNSKWRKSNLTNFGLYSAGVTYGEKELPAKVERLEVENKKCEKAIKISEASFDALAQNHQELQAKMRTLKTALFNVKLFIDDDYSKLKNDIDKVLAEEGE